jgi:PAS domain S-box-containing protein
LFFLLLTVLLPAAGIVVISSLLHRADAIREAENQAIVLVRSITAQQEQMAYMAKETLSTLAQLPDVKNLNVASCNALFKELNEQHPFFSTISLATPDGNLIAASTPFEPGSINLSDRKHFRDAISTMDFAVGEYIIGRVSKTPSFNFTYPVIDGKKNLIAILAVGLKLGEYVNFLTKAELPRDSTCTIADQKGVRLFHFPESNSAAPGTPVSREAFGHMSGDLEEGMFEKTSGDGVYRLYAFKRMRLRENAAPYLYIVAGIAKSRIVEGPNARLFRSLAGLAVLGVLVMVLARISAKRLLIEPIYQLVETARRFGDDDMAARTCLPHTSDEVGRLAKSFDEMASLLEIRNNERRLAEEEIQKAYGALDAKVALRTSELAAANEKLQMEVVERGRAESALRAALVLAENERSRAESIIAGMGDSLAMISRDFIIVYQNEICKARLGTRVGEHCYHMHGRDKICEECAVVECFADGSVHKGEKSRVINGKTRYFEIAASPLRDSRGEITGAVEIARDITERKLAQDALAESRQRLQDIIDFLPDATSVIDKEGRVIAWNLAMEEMTGVSAAAMLGKGDHEYALPFYGERRPALIDLVFEAQNAAEANYLSMERKGGVLSGLAHIPSLRGREAYLIGNASLLFDSNGEVAGAIQSVRDVTEQKLMEHAIARAEAKYRNIFENSTIGIFQVSPEGRFLSLNTAMARGLGYDSAEEVLSAIGEIFNLYVHTERRSDLRRLIEEYGSAREFEAEFFKKDGSIIWASLNVIAVRDREDKVSYFEGTARDITDSKALRSQLNQVYKMEAIGTLAGGIAHDFNNILTPIIGYSELSLNQVPADSRLHRNLMQILLSANRAKDLVKQILMFSRKTELEHKPVEAGLIVKEALKLLRSSLPSTIEIRQELSEDATYSTIMADPTQIHQVVMNLCANAAHAMREKGGILSITLENADIVSGTERGFPDMEPGPYLKLSVADTGHGMDEATKQRIFDPYFTTKGPDEGTGLGLAVVYGIVKSLSGRISVWSKVGEGTTFDLYFPGARTIPVSSSNLPEALLTGHGKILLVDDEKFIVDMMGEMLRSLGCEVIPRYSSADALEAFRHNPESFDLVLTDLTMPHMTGIDLAREILMIRPGIPIVICTGFSDTLDEDGTRLPGIRGFLRKPVALRNLVETLNKILGTK